ncbi:MAG: tetraacyldisaccharide 4'-kinase [Acidobacteria bacterium]|nr:tetraacyldisaccharide 4'-kinase [Acidobacteriota bacterium]
MIKSRLLKIILYPLYLLYRLVVNVRNRMYNRGWLKIRKLQVPVVSVGNLTVGGTGKTPTVIALGEALAKEGLKSCVLSRGYHRKDEKKIIEVSADSDPYICGDEPVLIARRLEGNATVWVGQNRFKTGTLALEQEAGAVVILDDGFQHRKLYRDLDIVLVDCTVPAIQSRMIPYGILREPFKGISRADVIVLTRSRFLSDVEPLKHELTKMNPDALVTTADLNISGFVEVSSGKIMAANVLKRKKIVAFSGIGNPLSFKAELITAGIDVSRAFGFPDHAVPSPARLAKVNTVAMEEKVAYIVTTEKDWVKLEQESIEALRLPLLVCQVNMIIEGMDRILAMIKEKHNAERTHQEN